MSTETRRFRCPTCGDRFEVDQPVADALLECGCVACGTTLSPDAFGSA